MGGPIPAPVWLAVWDSRTISLSTACAASVTLAPTNPARETRGRSSFSVSVGADNNEHQYQGKPQFLFHLTDRQVVVSGGCGSGKGASWPLSACGLLFYLIYRSSSSPTCTHRLQPLTHGLNAVSIALSVTLIITTGH